MSWTFRLSDLYLIEKEKLSIALLYIGMLIAFLGSMSPWFMWSIGSLYPILSAIFLMSSLMLSNTMSQRIFTHGNYLLPLVAFFFYIFYENVSMGRNVNAYIMITFRLTIFFTLFRLDTQRLLPLITFIAKVMGVLLAVSLIGHFLYLFGISLPGKSVELGEYYSFTNYYLFLLDDRNLFTIIPRFNSYFPEPSHVGSAAAFLLFAQRGLWKKWYNIVLLATIFFTFSLASYIYLIAIIFLNLWIERKHLFRKLLITISIVIAGIVTASTYNGGDNLVHDLILLRMEVDDGKLAGDDRVTSNFEKDYDNFLGSSDILFGLNIDTEEFGNAGYKPFFYEHGLMGIILIVFFYFAALKDAKDKRAVISVAIVASLYFIASAFMLLEKLVVPLYATAYREKRLNYENEMT